MSAGSAAGSSRSLTVRSGANAEMTIGAVTVSPASVRTPPTFPSPTTISVTLVRSRTSPPSRSSTSTRCEVSAPIPPRSFFICMVAPSGTPSPKASAAALPGVAGPR